MVKPMGRKKRKYVLSSWKGIDYIKSNAAKVKHSPASVRTYSIFGQASKSCKIMRQLLNDWLPQPKSIAIRHRLQNAFSSWLRNSSLTDPAPMDDIPFFNRLSLNEHNELKQFLKFPVEVMRSSNGQLELKLPAFDPLLQIKAPAGANELQIQIALAGLQMDGSSRQYFFTTDLSIAYTTGNLPAKEFDLPIDTAVGRLILVVVSLQYFTDNNVVVNHLNWKPAGIVGSFYN
jgi:hypothetical protein